MHNYIIDEREADLLYSGMDSDDGEDEHLSEEDEMAILNEAYEERDGMETPFSRLVPNNNPGDHDTAMMFNCADEMELRLEGKLVRDKIRDELWSRGFKRPKASALNCQDRFNCLVDPESFLP